MNILIVSEFYPPYIKGGAELSTSIMAEELVLKNKVYVLTQKHSKLSWTKESVIVLPQLFTITENFKNIRSIFFHLFIANLINPFINILITVSTLINYKIDILQIVVTSYLMIPIILAGILLRKKIVIDIRSGSLICPVEFSRPKCFEQNISKHQCFQSLITSSGQWPFYLEFFRVIFGIYKYLVFFIYKFFLFILVKYKRLKFIALSQYVKQQYVFAGINDKKIIVIFNPYEKKFLNITKTTKNDNLIFIGRIETEKGIWVLVKAMSYLSQEPYKLYIAGGGSEAEKLVKYLENNNIDNIVYLNKLNSNEVINQIKTTKVIVAPSIWPEPFGRFIQESYATKTPLITTNVGGIPEGIINRVTGILVPPNDPYKLSIAINELLTDKTLYSTIVDNLNKNLTKFDPISLSNQRMKIYTNL